MEENKFSFLVFLKSLEIISDKIRIGNDADIFKCKVQCGKTTTVMYCYDFFKKKWVGNKRGTINRFYIPFSQIIYTCKLKGPCAPTTKDCSMSAVFDGPAIKTP